MYQKSLQIKYCTHVKYSLLSKKKLVKTSLFKFNFSTDYIFNFQKKKKKTNDNRIVYKRGKLQCETFQFSAVSIR